MEKFKRCGWVDENSSEYIEYHDNEWGVPLHDDRKLYEMLCLEGQQAGLSWITILKKRDNYRKAFDNFDYEKIAKYDDKKIEELKQDSGIIRSESKIRAIIKNAVAFMEIQKNYGSFDKYIWSYVDYKPINNKIQDYREMPTQTELSAVIAKDLKKKGMSFVGPVIIYSFLEAVGIINDHEIGCFRKKEIEEKYDN
jgi:DNA-3-methyladenine glycosylase I